MKRIEFRTGWAIDVNAEFSIFWSEFNTRDFLQEVVKIALFHKSHVSYLFTSMEKFLCLFLSIK
jgi:hypothetical protein